jgi:hypothetical protein
LIPDTTSGSGTYRVYVTNDPSEGITNTADANRTLTLTSFGRGPNNSFAVVQAVVKMILMPPPPGAIVLPGPDVNFLGSNSNASGVMGGPESAVSLNSAAAQTTVEDYLGPSGINRINNYECDAGKGQVCINDDTATFPLEYSTVSGINGIVNTLTGSADVIYNNAGGATRTLTAADVGTTTNRKIVIVEGDAVLGPVNGAGILVVKGQLTLNGNFNYQGLILVVGEGNVLRNGGGSGTIEGAIVVANTNDATSNTVLGEPTFDTSGGGNSDINYNPTQINPPGTRPFVKLSWKQILR